MAEFDVPLSAFENNAGKETIGQSLPSDIKKPVIAETPDQNRTLMQEVKGGSFDVPLSAFEENNTSNNQDVGDSNVSDELIPVDDKVTVEELDSNNTDESNATTNVPTIQINSLQDSSQTVAGSNDSSNESLNLSSYLGVKEVGGALSIIAFLIFLYKKLRSGKELTVEEITKMKDLYEELDKLKSKGLDLKEIKSTVDILKDMIEKNKKDKKILEKVLKKLGMKKEGLIKTLKQVSEIKTVIDNLPLFDEGKVKIFKNIKNKLVREGFLGIRKGIDLKINIYQEIANMLDFKILKPTGEDIKLSQSMTDLQKQDMNNFIKKTKNYIKEVYVDLENKKELLNELNGIKGIIGSKETLVNKLNKVEGIAIKINDIEEYIQSKEAIKLVNEVQNKTDEIRRLKNSLKNTETEEAFIKKVLEAEKIYNSISNSKEAVKLTDEYEKFIEKANSIMEAEFNNFSLTPDEALIEKEAFIKRVKLLLKADRLDIEDVKTKKGVSKKVNVQNSDLEKNLKELENNSQELESITTKTGLLKKLGFNIQKGDLLEFEKAVNNILKIVNENELELITKKLPSITLKIRERIREIRRIRKKLINNETLFKKIKEAISEIKKIRAIRI